jgi:ATP-dependent Clp protease, protease subunit
MNAPPLQEDIYGVFAGFIDQLAVQKFFNNGVVAINRGAKRAHLLIQSNGGVIGDGVALYNFLRNIPIEVIAYNMGAVQSIGVIAFLGAKKRKATKTATFMIHRSQFSGSVPAKSEQLQAVTESLTIDDARMRDILRANIVMPEDKWSVHAHADLFLTAQQALEYKLIDEIAEFAPPLGATIFNVLA